ncbi:MAG: hypothetical protein ABSB22_12245 [Thermodesulfobacteriota bacterium]|jgi:hypothetical protein
MKKPIHKISKEILEKDFPIKGKVPGWYFRQEEVSNGAWEVEGVDQWGRRVNRIGDDPDQLFIKCEVAAQEINK